jgi:hypothetical protein
MRLTSIRFPLAACVFAVLLSACGGGDATAPGAGASRSTGFAIDGYLAGATILCDTNVNGVADTGEASVTTDSSGFFLFSPACTSALMATGGTNTDTGLPFNGKLRAPAGASVITPLTSLITGGASDSVIKTLLGLDASTNLLTLDPALMQAGSLVNADLMKKTLVLQQFAQKLTEVFAALSPVSEAEKTAIYSEVMAGLAQALVVNPGLFTGSTISQPVGTALIKAVVQRINNSAAMPSGIKGLNADSLAQVVFPALKTQAENMLGSSGTMLPTMTRLQQQSSVITTLVSANKVTLMAAPSPTTENLAADLQTQAAKTIFLSFDEPTVAFTGMGQYGGAAPSVVAGPAGGSGKALKITKPAGAEPWAGTFFGVSAIPFTSDRRNITARVFSTRDKATIRFKVEVSANDSVEVESGPIPANTWTTVFWKMPAISPSKAYKVIAITPDPTIATSGQSYYIDDISIAPAAAPVKVSFDAGGVAYQLGGSNDFGGTASSLESNPPAGTTGAAAKVIKPNGAQNWAGTTFLKLVNEEIVWASSRTVSVRVHASAGITVKLKLEEENESSKFVEMDQTTTVNGWQTLTFNTVSPAAGAYVEGTVYNVASIFFNFGVSPTSDQTFYFDDVIYTPDSAITYVPPPPAVPPTVGDTAPTTASGNVLSIFSNAYTNLAGTNFFPDWGQSSVVSDITVDGGDVKRMATLNYQGHQLASAQNVSSFTHVNISFYVNSTEPLEFFLINSSAVREQAAEKAYTFTPAAPNAWQKVSIPLTHFADVVDLTKIDQIKFVRTPSGTTVYYDNFYFSR